MFSENIEYVNKGDNIAVVGASGYLGGYLCALLEAEGYTVIKISRDDRGEGWRKWGEGCLDGVSAVFNFAGKPIDCRWNAEVKKQLWDSRVETCNTIAEWIGKMPPEQRPEVVLTASGVGIFGDRGDEELTEASSDGSSFLAQLCAAWEEAAELVTQYGVRSVSLRFGAVLGKDSKAFRKMLIPYKLFVGGPLGDGKGFFSWIHQEDALAAAVYALDCVDISGGVNMVANPVRYSAFSKAIGKALSRPALFPVPSFVLKLVLGEFSEGILASLRVYPEKLTEAGYTLKYPDVNSALADLTS